MRIEAFRALAPNDGAGSGGAGGGAGAGSGQQGQAGQQPPQGGQQGQQTPTWDEWHGKLPDDQKALIEGHTQGLKSALESERGTRKDLERQVRDLATKADKGSEAQAELTKLADQLKSGERQAQFYETAHAAGVRNLKLAWVAAKEDASVWRADGSLDSDALKKAYPELFGGGQAGGQGHAGAGAGSGGSGGNSINDIIRRAAGRG